MKLVLFPVVAALLASTCAGQQTVARISAEPPLSPLEIAQLESTVRANPTERDARLRLLRHYSTFAPSTAGVRSPFQSDRLAHVLYLIENSPADPVSSSTLTYVPAENGPYADTTDHAVTRDAWTRAVDRSRADPPVLLNAARFLYHEHPEDAEQLLRDAADREPGERRVAANLGFLYAMDILGITDPAGGGFQRTPAERQRLQQRAHNELNRSRNVFVLAGAGTALPNVFPRTREAGVPNGGEAVFQLASRLMARARELNPQERELQGPMPLLREFQQFQQTEAADFTGHGRPATPSPSSTGLPGTSPSLIRVGGSVLAQKLIEKPEAVYPPYAREVGIQGLVRFNVTIGPDGRVVNATLVSGHPLLVPAAIEVVRQYRYQPTLLNGVPVSVISYVDVPFTLTK